jgi:hypothetical protein
MDFGKLDEHSKINAQGTGLGLSICKRMIEKMGGTVTVDSIEGEGTTFTVSLVMKAQIISQEESNDNSEIEEAKDRGEENDHQKVPSEHIDVSVMDVDLL